MDDCGADGLGCMGPGFTATLRASYNTLDFHDTGDGLANVWIETWSPAVNNTDGEEYYDNFLRLRLVR